MIGSGSLQCKFIVLRHSKCPEVRRCQGKLLHGEILMARRVGGGDSAHPTRRWQQCRPLDVGRFPTDIGRFSNGITLRSQCTVSRSTWAHLRQFAAALISAQRVARSGLSAPIPHSSRCFGGRQQLGPRWQASRNVASMRQGRALANVGAFLVVLCRGYDAAELSGAPTAPPPRFFFFPHCQ